MQRSIFIVANESVKIDVEEFIARDDKPPLEIWGVVFAVDDEVRQRIAGYVACGPSG